MWSVCGFVWINNKPHTFPKVVSLPSKSVHELFQTFFDILFNLELGIGDLCVGDSAEIKRIQLPLHIHDRYLIIDDEVWLLGASAKDMGHGLCTIIKVDFTPEMVLSLLK